MVRDLQYAFRLLRHAPAFSIAVILTLAVAIGANTAIFSVVRAVLLRPLPYPTADRLLCVWHSDSPDYTWYTFSYPRFLYFQEGLRDVAVTAAYDDEIVTLTHKGEPLRVEGGRISANFFSLLGVAPAIGRDFMPAEDRHGATPVALLGDVLWRRLYGADPHIVGKTITVDSEEFTVIGVMPSGFQFLGVPVDIWRSRIVDTRTFAPTSVRLGASYLTIVARLNPGVTLAQVQAKLNVLGDQYQRENPGNSDLTGHVHAAPLQEKAYAGIRLTIFVLWAAVVCVLLIACANVANLVLARSVARYREMSVRLALGASRLQIGRQLIVESVCLSVSSIILSLPLSLWATDGLVSILRRTSAAVPDISLDAGILLFAFGIATLVGVTLGLIPLALLRGANAQDGMRSQARSFSTSKWSTRFRNSVVAAQIALSLALVSGAALLIESFVRMSRMATGVRTNNVLLLSLDLMPDKYDSWQQRTRFYDDVLQKVRTIPGIGGAAIASRVDLVSSGLTYEVQPEGRPDLGPWNPGARGRSVSSDYFRVLGIPLLSGRTFNEHDTATSGRVAIINEAFANKFFPGVNPVGKHLTYSTDRIYCEIVGVVRNVHVSVQSTAIDEQIYLPLSQRPWLVATLLVHAPLNQGMAAAIRGRVRLADPAQAIASIRRMSDVLANRLGRPRSTTSMIAVFAGTALFLATIGIYGVIAYSVAQRRKEIGIRMALGADEPLIRRLVFNQTFRILGVGLLLGVPASLMFGRLCQALLFQVKPGDPMAMASTVAVLTLVALCATYIPALRATRVDPLAALHEE